MKYIGIIGSRKLDLKYIKQVETVTSHLVNKGCYIATGGALGADLFCLLSLLKLKQAQKGCVFSAWQSLSGFPSGVRPLISQMLSQGGAIVWGAVKADSPHWVVCRALLERNHRLVSSCFGLVAFVSGASSGSLASIRLAVKSRLPVVVFPLGCCDLPLFSDVSWRALTGPVWGGGFKAIY